MINTHSKAEVAIGENTAVVWAMLTDAVTKFSCTQEHDNCLPVQKLWYIRAHMY
jgi:hypothetical protein